MFTEMKQSDCGGDKQAMQEIISSIWPGWLENKRMLTWGRNEFITHTVFMIKQ